MKIILDCDQFTEQDALSIAALLRQRYWGRMGMIIKVGVVEEAPPQGGVPGQQAVLFFHPWEMRQP